MRKAKRTPRASARALRKKSYPRKDPPESSGTDNLAIWIGGNEAGSSWYESRTNFEELRDDKLRKIKNAIEGLEGTIKRHHIKIVKGRKYWYLWDQGKHRSQGSAENGDPREQYRKKIKQLQEKHAQLKKNIQSCIIKKFGDHLVLNVQLFKKFVDRKLPEDAVMVSKILEGTQANKCGLTKAGKKHYGCK